MIPTKLRSDTGDTYDKCAVVFFIGPVYLTSASVQHARPLRSIWAIVGGNDDDCSCDGWHYK